MNLILLSTSNVGAALLIAASIILGIGVIIYRFPAFKKIEVLLEKFKALNIKRLLLQFSVTPSVSTEAPSLAKREKFQRIGLKKSLDIGTMLCEALKEREKEGLLTEVELKAFIPEFLKQFGLNVFSTVTFINTGRNEGRMFFRANGNLLRHDHGGKQEKFAIHQKIRAMKDDPEKIGTWVLGLDQ